MPGAEQVRHGGLSGFVRRRLEQKVEGDMTLEWLRDEKVILQRSIAEEPMFPEGVVLIMAADEDAEGDYTAHYFDSRAVWRILQMSFQDGVWKWWRHAGDPEDFDQRFEGTLSADGRRSKAPATSSKTASGSTISTSPTPGCRPSRG